jgi:hypothetical protein
MKEALKLALELLKSAHVSTDLVWKRHDCVQALEEALAKQEQGKPVDWSDEQLKMLNFLYGAGEFDGVWFEQKHPTEKGAFWWRKHMKRLFDTAPQPKQEQGELVAWRETHGKVIKALAGIVAVHTPDKLFDLDAIPRDPVMALVQDIKAALDKYKPPQRTWVGLTDVEWMNIVNKDQAWFGQRPDEVAHEVAKLVEAKMKEKNDKN